MIRLFLLLAFVGLVLALALGIPHSTGPTAADTVNITVIRHATTIIEHNGHRILVDPGFENVGVYPTLTGQGPFANLTNPMVPLPMTVAQILTPLPDIVYISHNHIDHFDTAAQKALPKEIPILCEARDVAAYQAMGFTNFVQTTDGVPQALPWDGAPEVTTTGGEHGHGDLGVAMGKISGLVLRFRGSAPGSHLTVHVVGDSVWDDTVRDDLVLYKPDVVVLNVGGATLFEYSLEPITMDCADVAEVVKLCPNATRIVADHFETYNHCRVRRADLVADLTSRGYGDELAGGGAGKKDGKGRIWIPADGETRAYPLIV